MDADHIHFKQAKKGYGEDGARRASRTCVRWPYMPSGAINITNLPIRELLIQNMNVSC